MAHANDAASSPRRPSSDDSREEQPAGEHHRDASDRRAEAERIGDAHERVALVERAISRSWSEYDVRPANPITAQTPEQRDAQPRAPAAASADPTRGDCPHEERPEEELQREDTPSGRRRPDRVAIAPDERGESASTAVTLPSRTRSSRAPRRRRPHSSARRARQRARARRTPRRRDARARQERRDIRRNERERHEQIGEQRRVDVREASAVESYGDPPSRTASAAGR